MPKRPREPGDNNDAPETELRELQKDEPEAFQRENDDLEAFDDSERENRDNEDTPETELRELQKDELDAFQRENDDLDVFEAFDDSERENSDNKDTPEPELRPLQKDELDAFQEKSSDALVRFASIYYFVQGFDDPEGPSGCVKEVFLKHRDRIKKGRPALIRSEKHLRNLIYRAVRTKCRDYIEQARRRDELATQDTLRRALSPHKEVDVDSAINVKDVLRQGAQCLPARQPQVLAFLLQGLSPAAIAKKLGVHVSTVKRDIVAIKLFIKANLGVLFAWLSRRKSRVIAGTAIVAALLLRRPNDPACYTNNGAPGEPILCLHVKQISGTTSEFQACKQDGRFQNPYRVVLRSHYKAEITFRSQTKSGILDAFDASFEDGPAIYGYPGDQCSPWVRFNVSNGMVVDAVVSSPAACTDPTCRYFTGRVTIPKQNQ